MWKKKRNKMPIKDWLIGAALSIVASLAPAKELFAVALGLIFIDLVTGVLKARKEGKKIHSAGFRRTVSKFCIYMTAIAVGYWIESIMLKGFLPVSNIAAGLISLVEGKSIFENLDVLNGQPIFKSLVKKLGSVNDIDQTAETVVEETKEEKKDGESL
jgi:phage-related holin